MTDRILDRELKKGSAELLILALRRAATPARLRDQPADRTTLERRPPLQGSVALPAPLSPRASWMDRRELGRESGTAPAALLPAHAQRAKSTCRAEPRRGPGSSRPSSASLRCAHAYWKAILTRRLAERRVDRSITCRRSRTVGAPRRLLPIADRARRPVRGCRRACGRSWRATRRSSANCAGPSAPARPRHRSSEPTHARDGSAASGRMSATPQKLLRRSRDSRRSPWSRWPSGSAPTPRFFDNQRRHAAAAALSRASPARADLGKQRRARLASVVDVGAELPRLPRADHDVRRDRRERRPDLHDDGHRWSRIVRGNRVTAEFLPVLGVLPAIGRNFTADEDRPGGECAPRFSLTDSGYAGSARIDPLWVKPFRSTERTIWSWASCLRRSNGEPRICWCRWLRIPTATATTIG